MRELKKSYKRVVVKIGSSLFYSTNKVLDFTVFDNIVHQIVHLVKEGKEIIIVSSGAIALGMDLLDLEERPKKLDDLQAAAAIGQNELMNTYRRVFGGSGCFGAQILLTWEDFDDRKRYLNARNTLLALLEHRKYRVQRPIPIVNENDTVSTEEIKFGDNDRLSALVASLVSADILIILSDIEGLLDRDRKTLIKVVGEITPQVKALACPTDKKTCVGGMITKVEAAKIAMDSGIPCIIADGRSKDIMSILKEPGKYGTLFSPKKCLTERERWIAFGTKPKGKVVVDNGAKVALKNKKSLLSVGITAVQGTFECGDIVSILDRQNCEFARGKVTFSSRQLDKFKGRRSDKEVIHCDNMVIL